MHTPKPFPCDHLPGICVPLAQASPAALLAQSSVLLPQYPFQELRLDYLSEPAAALPTLEAHLRAHPELLLLATCRRVESGGQFQGTVAEERDVLLGAARAGCRLVDLALESAEQLGAAGLAPLRAAGACLILSWHDFTGCPDLEAVLRRMRPLQPDLAKLVPTAQQLADNLALLDCLHSRQDGFGLVGMCMGEAGLPSRVLGLRAGSRFTFAAASAEEGTAPGQVSVSTMQSMYRPTTLGQGTAVYGVAGSPVHSSLSPLMLNTAFQAAGTDAVYLPLLTDDPHDLLRWARGLPLAGFSATMPLKQSLLPLLDRMDPLAKHIGAVNTVRREPDGTLSGFNTDAAGIVVPLRERLELRGARVLVLGAGGAARAAVFACADAGAHVSVLNRTFAAAQSLAAQAGAHAVQASDLATLPRFDALINATPAGMHKSTATLPLPAGALPAELVFDLVYNPMETPLLRQARREGLQVIPGVEMFVHQGARQFELWTGQPAPVQAMRTAVLGALQAAAAAV